LNNEEQGPTVPDNETEAVLAAERLILDEDGKPQGSFEEPTESAAPTGEREAMAEMLTGLIVAGFAVLASKRGDHWIVTQEEAAMIAAPGAELLEEAGFTTSTPEVRFMIAAGAILIPKWYVDRKLSKGDKATPVEHEEA
jgi:hypothetical protein